MSPTKSTLCPTILPEKCSERNLVSNVVSLLNDYIPTSSIPKTVVEEEKIVWVHFENCSLNDFDLLDLEASQSPLVILVGTRRGLQIWSIPIHGEAVLLFSYYQNYVHRAKLLQTPELDEFSVDNFTSRRPIIALCEATSRSRSKFFSLRLFSIRNNEDLRTFQYSSAVTQLQANKRFLIVGRVNCISVISICDLQEAFTITNCRLSVDDLPSPIALGSCWLAFADAKRIYPHSSEGGDMSNDDSKPIATTVMKAKKRIWGSLSALAGSIATSSGLLLGGSVGDVSTMATGPMGRSTGTQKSSGAGDSNVPTQNHDTGFSCTGADEEDDDHIGIVTLVNLLGLRKARLDLLDSYQDDPGLVDYQGDSGDNIDVHELVKTLRLNSSSNQSDKNSVIVAHFQAHRWVPVTNMEFDSGGVLLVTAAYQGHSFHVFRISAHPFDCRQTAVHHLYTLVRGATPCSVVDIQISRDSRWVAVSSNHGTTHLFPMTPYGGPVTVRTHSQPRVVNRASRYHKSAGIDEMDLLRPSLSRNQTSSSFEDKHQHPVRIDPLYPNRQYNTTNPRLPPYPITCTIDPLLQIRQQYHVEMPSSSSPSATTPNGGQRPTHHTPINSSTSAHKSYKPTVVTTERLADNFSVPLVTRFATSRCFIPGSTNTAVMREKIQSCKVVESIFIMNADNKLIEYELKVSPAEEVKKGGKIYQDGGIKLEGTAMGQWRFPIQTSEIIPPFPSHHPLISSAPASPFIQETNGRRQNGNSKSIRKDNYVASSVSPPTHASHWQTSSGSTFEVSPSSVHFSRFSSKESLHSGGGAEVPSDGTERWVSQVEITTHMGPHRRIWMGPQIAFKIYQDDNPVLLAVDSGTSDSSSPFFHSVPFHDTGMTSGMDNFGVNGYPRCSEYDFQAALPASRPLSMPQRRSNSHINAAFFERTRNHSSASDSDALIFIEAGSYQDSSFGGSLSSLTRLDTFHPDSVTQSLADAMLEDFLPSKSTDTASCYGDHNTPVIHTSGGVSSATVGTVYASEPVFISEEDFLPNDISDFNLSSESKIASSPGHLYNYTSLRFPTNSDNL